VKRPQRYIHPATQGPTGRKPTRRTAKPLAKPIEERAERTDLKKLRGQRRKYEKQEIRRFTRRTRFRRGVISSVVAAVVLLAVVISLAVFSPILALRTITVTGASRLDAKVVSSALSSELGKPLALVDFGEITRKLADFPLIRSYTTESVPPSTLVVSIVERVPIATVSSGSGYHTVDPAGVTVESSDERPAGLPLLNIESSSIKNAAFRSVVRVLLALPADLLARVDTVTATTNDDVSFVLVGVGQSVVWGSADRSAYKARVLAALIATQNPAASVEYDVSAPDSVVVRPK
jgi:cell division protein FtsQ